MDVTPLTTAQAKRGRKPKHHVARDGKTIEGLAHDSDGRWRIRETGERFREPDEALAVARFRAWEQSHKKRTQRMAVPAANFKAAEGMGRLLMDMLDDKIPARLFVDEKGDAKVGQDVLDEVIWPWLRKMLIDAPDYVAQRVGIPEVARLGNLPKPMDPIKLETLIDAYEKHADSKDVVKSKVRRAWKDFVNSTGAETVTDITPAAAASWRDQVKARGLAPPSVKDLFVKAKTVLSYARKRGFDPRQVREALDACAVLTPPKGSETFDPHPIDPADFHKLLNGADEWEKALLLTMLNLCLYGSEAMDLRWEDLDLDKATYVADRGKTKIVRVGVLWPRTLVALRGLRQKGQFVFTSSTGLPYHPNSLRKLFDELRKRAKVSDSVKMEDVRDGSYTAACEAGVDLNVCRCLGGHRSGMPDHYVKRRPRIVALACEAVEKEFFEAAARA